MKNSKNYKLFVPHILDDKFVAIRRDQFFTVLYLSDKIIEVENLRNKLSEEIGEKSVDEHFDFKRILDSMKAMKKHFDRPLRSLPLTDFKKNKCFLKDEISKTSKRVQNSCSRHKPLFSNVWRHLHL